MATRIGIGPRLLRRVKQGKHTAYQLFVPPEMGEKIPEGTLFMPEWTDDGIKFRAIEREQPPEQIPDWVQKTQEG